jgi:hypothetical protein
MSREIRRPTDHVTCRHCHRDYRAITFRHLRNIHGYDDEHPIEEYKRHFRVSFALCGESRKKISRAKELFWDKRGQHWTPPDVLAAIRQLYRRTKSLRCGQVPVRLYEAGRRYFDTWERAIQKAGLDYEAATGVKRWTAAKVIERIQKLAAESVPLNGTNIMNKYPDLHQAAVKRFPYSWNKALRAAGFDPNVHKMQRGRWNRIEVENWIRKQVSSEHSILAKDVPKDLLSFVQKRLKTRWTTFVESLGIPYPGVVKKLDWTRRSVLQEIRRLKAEGHPMNLSAVKRSYVALVHQVRKFYGSWDRARAAAHA